MVAPGDPGRDDRAGGVELLLQAMDWVRLHPGGEVDTSVEWGMGAGDHGDAARTVDEGAARGVRGVRRSGTPPTPAARVSGCGWSWRTGSQGLGPGAVG